MSERFRPLLPGVLAAACLLAAACSSKPPAQVAVPPTPTPTVVSLGPTPAPTPVPTPAAAEDTLPTSVDEINRRGYLKDAFFDFDRSEIRTSERDALAGDATWLRAHPGIRVRIEGHCDERGTADYNMALGERRAAAVQEYLASLGVDASRTHTISYGKERPFALGHDEAAWAQNRRGHFVVTAR
ncbi:MAG TPA: peptidoglycan-associated lipoprotein Pal [Thermoanaerobaculia bacterium]|nr:peptidoglycan-associated lipoprotein Pal [Thermoanaerobaculia bacterium]